MKSNKLNDIIREFSLQQTGPFDFEELFFAVKKNLGKATAEQLFDAAYDSEYLFASPSEEHFVPRHIRFQGAQFRVNPFHEEIEGGFLMPGHRLMPFIARDTFPGDARLVLPEGTVAEQKIVSVSGKVANRCLLFYGPFGMMDYLIADQEDNADGLMETDEEEANFKVTVFDLADFFRKQKFKEGDSLIFTVTDWLTGTYSVRHVPASSKPVSLASVRRWTSALRAAFEEVVADKSIRADCYEQMAQMIFMANENSPKHPVTINPPLSLAAFFAAQNDLTLKTMGQNSFIWPVDADPAEELLNLDRAGFPEDPSELAVFFDRLGLSISQDNVEAYIRDALGSGITDPDAVLIRMIAGRDLLFPTANEQKTFHRLWREFWDEVRSTYSRESDPFREIRKSFLVLNDKCLQILRQLDKNGLSEADALSNPAFIELGHLGSMIDNALMLFNNPESASDSKKQPLSGVVDQLSEAIDFLAAQLVETGRSQLRIVPKTEKIYQLKITLTDIKPPVWRRILIPASLSLADLHEAIQAVMGWSNAHLYQFKNGQTIYGMDPEEEMMFDDEIESTSDVSIGQVLCKEKDKIIYEYDLGDFWEHTILLEKILNPEEAQDQLACTGGKRACPPEDCGGPGGYDNLLRILENPESAECKKMVNWLGGKFDPEAFNVKEANARLQESA